MISNSQNVFILQGKMVMEKVDIFTAIKEFLDQKVTSFNSSGILNNNY